MMDMPLSLTGQDIAVRLVLTMAAGALIGFNREARGRAAGFRTTILVCLAASIAMMQANILLSMSGKTPQSFTQMDVMRLPLGILTGVGFIGGGAILRKGDLVTGVTTAATLWLVTVIGLCFGGGQLILGACATVLGVVTLWLLKRVDASIPHERRARVVIVREAACDVLRDFPALVAGRRCRSHFVRQAQPGQGEPVEYEFRISWRGPKGGDMAIDLLALIGSRYQVRIFDLTSEDTG